MINTLRDYYPNSIPEVLTTSGGLAEKVSPDGALLPFPGNTVVFLLEDSVRQALCEIRDALYEACGYLFAERLETPTFHVTLHDLANGALLPEKKKMAAKAARILDEIRAEQLPPIPMKATWTFNMVNTSIVLGLEPDGDAAWEQLDGLYERFQQVRPLPYALTPHITLAYFLPGVYERTDTLRRAMKPIDLRFELDPQKLVLQDFDHMNAYQTVY